MLKTADNKYQIGHFQDVQKYFFLHLIWTLLEEKKP